MSTAETLSPRWASNTNYAAGPDTGTPTKVDPSSDANGFIKGVVAAPQHVNYLLSNLTDSARRVWMMNALRLRPLAILGDAIDEMSSLAAVLVGGAADPLDPVVLVGGGSLDVYRVAADDDVARNTGGGVASITDSVLEAASNGSRIAVIGNGGNLASYSNNGGGSWSAAGAGIGGAVEFLVYLPPNALAGGGDMFICGGSGTGSAYRSPDVATIWDSLASTFAAVKGLAVLGGATANAGYVVCLGNSGSAPRMSVLTDGGNGGDFSGTQQPPNAATADEPGSIAGAPSVSGVGAAVYHVMRTNSGARLRLASTADGTTWVSSGTPTIEAPSGVLFDAGTATTGPRLLICQTTGLMVIVAPLSNGCSALYASQDFADWVGPLIVGTDQPHKFALAGGRLFMAETEALYGSDGIGLT